MSGVRSVLTDTLRAALVSVHPFNGCDYPDWFRAWLDEAVPKAVDAILGSGVAVTQLPEPATEDVDDDERPKQAGDYLKRSDTRSEVWVEGLHGCEPYVFFGRRGMGPSYMPAEYAEDVAAALLAASRAVVSEGETR